MSEDGSADLIAFLLGFVFIFVIGLAFPVLIPLAIAATSGSPETSRQIVESVSNSVAGGFIPADEAEERASELLSLSGIPSGLVSVRCGEVVSSVDGLVTWAPKGDLLVAGDRYACAASGNVSHWPVVAPFVDKASGFRFEVVSVSVSAVGDDDVVSS